MKQTETSEQKIIISERLPESYLTSESFIWFKPTDLRWNDFGFVTKVLISLVERGAVVSEHLAKAAYLDPEEEKYVGVGDALLKLRERGESLIETESRNVISLAATMEDYRRVVRELGVERANSYLRNATDLVAISSEGSKRDIHRKGTSSDVFKFSLSREAEAYYAYKNASHILRGLNQEDISSGPEQVLITISDQNGNDVAIDFQFSHDSVIPKRTCVIIGKNGVGKSRALGNIARKALHGIRRRASYDADRIIASRIIAFTPGNEFTGNFPNEHWKRPATFYKRLSTSRARHSSSGNTATASIVELSRNDRSIAENSRLSIFLDAVSAINSPDEIAFRSTSGRNPILLSELRRSSEQRRLELLFDLAQAAEPGRIIEGTYYHLSTGEVRFIKLLAQACTYIENGSLLLIDEPETHLHPNFIARFMSALEKLLADTGSCAIVATHSVYVVREVFHDQVVVVERDKAGVISAKSAGMRTFGADISSISTFVFGEEGSSFLAEETMMRIRSEGLSFGQIREKYGSFLSREILSELRDEE